MHPDTASDHFIDYLQDIQQDWNGTGEPVFTVALDGENAWENYQYDLDGDGRTEYTGNMFRELMYQKIEEAQDAGWLKTVTPAQYLADHPVGTLETIPLKTGSWANDLTVWIGEDDENKRSRKARSNERIKTKKANLWRGRRSPRAVEKTGHPDHEAV